MPELEFLTVANLGYLEMAKNLIANFQKPWMLHHYLNIECLDSDLYNNLLELEKLYPNINLCSTYLDKGDKEYFNFGALGFNRLCFFKLTVMRNYIQEGYQIWYTDCDIAYFKDPEPWLDPSIDIQFESSYGVDPMSAEGISLGCLKIESNVRTLDYINRVIEIHKNNPSHNDQDSSNHLFKSSGIRPETCTWCSFKILDPQRFQNGFRLIKQGQWKDPDKVSGHVNFHTGNDSKIEKLKESGGWFL